MKLLVCLIPLMVLMPAPALAADGRALYQRECAACHGADGAANTKLGQQLKPLPAHDLRPKILSRAEIFRIIVQGREKTGMHAHGVRLSQAEIIAIVNYVQSLPYRVRPERGRKRFQQYCARCHGSKAKGNALPGTPSLLLSERSDIDMADIIRHGHAGTIMGGFKSELSNAEIADIVAWIRLLRYGLLER